MCYGQNESVFLRAVLVSVYFFFFCFNSSSLVACAEFNRFTMSSFAFSLSFSCRMLSLSCMITRVRCARISISKWGWEDWDWGRLAATVAELFEPPLGTLVVFLTLICCLAALLAAAESTFSVLVRCSALKSRVPMLMFLS